MSPIINDELIHQRLHNQHLLGPEFANAADAVSYFGAVQGQDYLYSLWALGLRIEGTTEAGIEQAINDRLIIRTWPLRGTIHYVTAADARWMVKLSAERVLGSARTRFRQLELDDDSFNRSRKLITAILREHGPMARSLLLRRLEEGGVSTAGQRGYHMLWYHAHQGLIGIGPREGKQPTIVLLDEWLPATKELARDEASAELARRYFTSHGPATIKDYTWWSGLAPAEARSGMESIKSLLVSQKIGETEYWSFPSPPPKETSDSTAHLLPFLDEYLVAYKDRDAVQPPEYNALVPSGNVLFHPPFLINGRVAGIWKRQLMKDRVVITVTPLRTLAQEERETLAAAAERFGRFVGLSIDLSFVS